MEIDEIDRVLAKVPNTMRVAVAAAAIERIRDFYRFGNLRPTLAELGAVETEIARHKEIFDVGLELAWSCAEGEKIDEGLASAIVGWVRDHLWQKQVPKTVSDGSACALKAVHFALLAREDKTTDSTEQALSMAELVASLSLRQLGIGDEDDDVPGDVGDAEEAWQIAVVKHVQKNKSAKPSQELFAALLAKTPTWQKYLEQYKHAFST